MAAAAVVRGETVLWSMSVPCGRETLAEDLGQLVAQIPKQGWPRPRVFVALGTAYARTKTVRGLPATSDAKTIGRLIAMTPERFFIGVPGELRTTAVRIDTPGSAFVAALDGGVIAIVQQVVEEAGYRIVLCTSVEVASEPDSPSDVNDTVRGAISVAAIGRAEPVSYRPVARDAAVRRTRVRRSILATISVALIVWLTLPGLLAWHTVRHSRAVVASLARHRGDALRTERELDVVMRAIGTVADFEQRRMSKTSLLAQLSEALPNGSALSTLKVDSTGGMVIGVAPHAADIVHALESIPGVTHVEIVGPVSHDVANAASFDRVTVRFQGAPGEDRLRRPMVLDSAGGRR
jgi:hypothetical protein